MEVMGSRSLDHDTVQAPEVQQMYSLNMPVSRLRTKVRQEFERHRFVNKISVVDMLLFQCHAEFQVRYVDEKGSARFVKVRRGRISIGHWLKLPVKAADGV